MNRSLTLILLASAATLLPGCRSFDREWRLWSPADPAPKKGKLVLFHKGEPPPTPQSPFDGRWIGKWTSDRHKKPFSSEAESGYMQGVFTRIDPYRYRTHIRAEWLLGASDHLTELYGHTNKAGDVLYLKGQDQVSKVFGGTYKYEGTVTATHFRVRYDSSYDSGTFEMTKLK